MSEEKVSIAILGIISLIAIVGLILMFSGGSTGALFLACASGQHFDKAVLTCVNNAQTSGLPCSPNSNGQCSQDDCLVGIQTGRCDTRCNCVLTSAPTQTGQPLTNQVRRPSTPTSQGLPCTRNSNGYCSQDDCLVGIQTGRCDTNCNCVLTASTHNYKGTVTIVK
ncbi:hypothetical protein J4219_08230 [Candidatus Woesearchaeota archaeon]|nr:hypothetical protein [Candidatus Woesearchaeota archaeon]